MRSDRMLVLTLAILLAAGLAGADQRIVQNHKQDAFTMMGQTQPAVDEQHVSWIGDRKLRMDQGSTSTIVAVDANKMYVIDHDAKSYTEIDLPVDLEKVLPPGMAEQMMAMLNFQITVTPSAETKKIGEWNAKRYDLKLTSAMMTVDSVLWASTETPVDHAGYHDLYANIVSLQPGMSGMVDQLRRVEGFVVAQEAKMTMQMMGDTSIGSSDVVVSIEQVEAPAGTYAPPAGYAREDFDYMKMMQSR
jgi:hypothetical protein